MLFLSPGIVYWVQTSAGAKNNILIWTEILAAQKTYLQFFNIKGDRKCENSAWSRITI